jgi:hypothetical protein
MATLEDTVRWVVGGFMNSDELFTALDVSNLVKAALPHARHREVRDVVRAMFATEIEPQGWARSPITVTLSDGSTQEALLYHPLSDAWDLDNKYDARKRAVTSLNPTTVAAATVATAATVAPAPTGTIGALIKQKLVSNPSATPTATVTVTATTPVPMPTARHLWNNLFAQQPSLFPTK